MANLNDYDNKNKLGTSNGVRFFPAPNLLNDKIPQSYPTDPQESPATIASQEGTATTNANLVDYFSYSHDLISPHGIARLEPGVGIKFADGTPGTTAPFRYSPLKDSLGAFYVFQGTPGTPGDTGNTIWQGSGPSSIARVNQNYQSIPSSGKYYSAVKSPVPLPTAYQQQSMDSIQFSNMVGGQTSVLEADMDEIIGPFKYRQYVLLYGHVDDYTSGTSNSYSHQYSKMQLGFLSLFFNVSKKRNGWTYFWPTAVSNSPSMTFVNTQSISFYNGLAGILSYDKTIDKDGVLLSSIAGSWAENWRSQIYAMSYQLLVGGSMGGPKGFGTSGEVKGFNTLPAGIEKKTFTDFNYSLEVPISEEIVSYLNQGSNEDPGPETLIADVKPVYNYAIPSYHQAMSLIPEIRIPNIYIAAKEGIDGLWKGKKAEPLLNDPGAPSLQMENMPYFKNMANSFMFCDETKESVYSNLEYTKLTNIVLDHGTLTTAVEDLKNLFPMHVEVEFDTPNYSLLKDETLKNLYENDIIHEYIRFMLSYFYGPKAYFEALGHTDNPPPIGRHNFQAFQTYIRDLGILPPQTYGSSQRVHTITKNKTNDLIGASSSRDLDIDVVDFNKWFSYYGELSKSGWDGNLNAPFLIAPNQYNNYTTFIGEKAEYAGGHYLMKFVNYGKAKPGYRAQVINFQRTMNEIMNGTKAVSLPLFYVIEKKSQSGELIQRIIIPAEPGENKRKIKYIDTQVKYNKSYRYTIKAHTLVIGSDYKFEFSMDQESGAIASQAGYGKIMKRDLIFSEIIAAGGPMVGQENLIAQPNTPLGDAFNFAGNISDGQWGMQIGTLDSDAVYGMSAQAAQSAGEVVEPLSASEKEAASMQYTIFPEEFAGGYKISHLRPYYFYTEKTILQGNPVITPKVWFTSKDDAVSGKYTLEPSEGGNSYGYTYVDPDTGHPASQSEVNKTVVYENSYGQLYFVGPNGGSYFIDEEGGLITKSDIEAPGSQYSLQNSKKKLAVVRSLLYPKAKIFDTPYFEEQYVKILDKPPITPIVNFYPMRDSKNNLLITFENQTGDYEDVPSPILSADNQTFLNMRIAQKRQWKNSQGAYIIPELRFKSDDFASQYQVFRIAGEKPASPSDFENSLYQVINTRERTAFVDILQPNVKYYYIFRTVDLNFNLSNPTYLYEVEMVENSGAVYPLINIVDYATPPADFPSRNFNRYMKIEPSLPQKIVNENKSGIGPTGAGIGAQKPTLGLREESVWNQKKFKFRIKSVNTGKAIDLNVSFKTKHKEADVIESCD